MEVTYSKKKRPPYINFRMRKLINRFIKENHVELSHLNLDDKAQFIADGIESIVSSNYWIKDKQRDISNVVSINKKVA